jgi:hypothetical protein
LLALDDRQHALHASLPIRKQIDVLNSFGDSAGQGAVFQPDWNEEDFVQRDSRGAG